MHGDRMQKCLQDMAAFCAVTSYASSTLHKARLVSRRAFSRYSDKTEKTCSGAASERLVIGDHISNGTKQIGAEGDAFL